MNRGKPSSSPPVQLTGPVPARNISQYSVTPRGQTPPFREDVQASYTGHSYISPLPPGYLHGALPANLPHDMNKQSVQQQQQPPQSQRLTPGGAAQPQIMYTQQGPRPQNPQSMQGSFYGQQTNPRAARPQIPMGMPQHTPMFHMYMPPGGYPGAPTPIHMVSQSANPYFPSPQPGQRMPTNLSPYSVTTSQQNQQYPMGPNPNSNYYNSPTNTNTPMFFPQSQSIPMPQQQRPPSASSMTSQQPYQKRERTVLKIVDPSTGKDIMDEIVGGGTQRHTPPQSGASSARATPVSPTSTPSPPQQNEIAAQFAAQVAATLNPVPRQQQPHLQQMPQMGMQIPPPPVQFAPKPEGPAEGLATVQMPPKVPSPAQYQQPTMAPANPQMMLHTQQGPQFVIQPQVPPHGYSPPVQTQAPPQPPPQMRPQLQTPPPPPQPLQKQMPPAQVSEPVVVAKPPVPQEQDIPRQSPVPDTEVKTETVETAAPTPETEVQRTTPSPLQTPNVKDVPKTVPNESETVPEPAFQALATKEQGPVIVKEDTEPTEPKDSTEKQLKPTETVTDTDVTSSVSSNQLQGEVVPPSIPKSETTQSAVVSEKTEKWTSESVDSVKAPPPQVTTEVKPVISPSPSTDSPTSQTGDSDSVGEGTGPSKPSVQEKIEVSEETSKPNAVTPPPQSEVSEKPEEESATEVKAVAKTKNKVRAKDLNAKGESKQGSDMDLFLDAPAKKADVDLSGSSNVDEEPVTETPEKEEPVAPVQPSPPPTIMTSEESKEVKIEKPVEEPVDNRVMEENQKNEVKTNENITTGQENSTPTATQELKYQYKEDQWSPLNPEGKKQYDRAFLLEMQYASESVTKPEGLPHLPDVILDEPHSKKSARPYPVYDQSRGGSFDFTPGFVRPSPRGGSSSMGGGGKSRTQQGRKEIKKIIPVSIQQDIKLHQAEKAWKPSTTGPAAKEDKNSDLSKTEDLYKRVTSILNKLTPQKFSTLLQQMTLLKIDTEERLKGVIDLIFEKAISEPGFCVAYANMCKYLMMLKVPVEGKPGETVNFRKLLLNRCQREFEKDNREEVEYNNRMKEIEKAEESLRAGMLEELELVSTKARRRSLGNIRFIGELFKLKMLTENIMHDCVLKLLKSHDEESLECLCRLLTTIGKELDSDKARPRVDQYFQQMTKIVAQRKTSSRVRFMLQDVIELRQNRWVPRRDENNPKTIDQIHKEVAQEAQEKAILIQQITSQPQHRGGRGNRGDRGGRPPGQGNTGEDGWSTVGVRAARATIDPTKLKLSKPQHVDENIQLGPGTRFASWGRGSSAGGTKQQEADRPSTPGNRFSALSSRGEDSHDPRARGRGRGISPARSDVRSRPSSSRDTPRSKQGPRSSMEMERQSALATAKSYSTSGRSTPPSREESRENSRSRDSRRDQKPAAAAAPPPPQAPSMSDDEIEKKTKAIMDEYLHIQDSKEAEMCIKELRSAANIYRFVAAALNHVIERSEVARRQTGNLLHDAVKNKLITVDNYIKGLGEVLEFAEDMEIDIPKIWTYLGELIGPMVQDGSVPLNFLKQVCDPLKQNNKAGVLVAEVLHDAAHRLGHIKVGEIWKSSGLQWSDFVPSSEISTFIKDKKLEFTLVEETLHRSPSVSSENIRTELEKLLIKQNSDNEEVFDWIEGNVEEEKVKSPKFIRTLMSLVCSSAIEGTAPSCKVKETVIKKRGVLLRKYLDYQAEMELQALYSLQALANKLEYPQGLLRSFFEILYDEDIITEDAFHQWESSKDPAEQEGKGVALKQVIQFFTWLGETEEESQDDS